MTSATFTFELTRTLPVLSMLYAVKWGVTLEKLELDLRAFGYMDIWVSGLHYSNLPELVLKDPHSWCELPSILKASSGKLRHLDISGRRLAGSAIAAISKHCLGLRSLASKYDTVSCEILPMWKALGPTLEKLSIRDVISTDTALESKDFVLTSVVSLYDDDIAKYCKKLTNLHIERRNCVRGSRLPLSPFLKIGSQLGAARIMGRICHLLPEHFEKLISNCPLAVFRRRNW